MATLTSMDGIDPTTAPSGSGCAECDAGASPGWWVNLRRCARCGHVGCCDSSPGQHATGHFASTAHPVMRSYQPGEEWFYDYRTQVTYESGPDLAPPLAVPPDVGTPGPADRLPADWAERVRQ